MHWSPELYRMQLLKKNETVLCMLLWDYLQDTLEREKSKVQNRVHSVLTLLNKTDTWKKWT